MTTFSYDPDREIVLETIRSELGFESRDWVAVQDPVVGGHLAEHMTRCCEALWDMADALPLDDVCETGEPYEVVTDSYYEPLLAIYPVPTVEFELAESLANHQLRPEIEDRLRKEVEAIERATRGRFEGRAGQARFRASLRLPNDQVEKAVSDLRNADDFGPATLSALLQRHGAAPLSVGLCSVLEIGARITADEVGCEPHEAFELYAQRYYAGVEVLAPRTIVLLLGISTNTPRYVVDMVLRAARLPTDWEDPRAHPELNALIDADPLSAFLIVTMLDAQRPAMSLFDALVDGLATLRQLYVEAQLAQHSTPDSPLAVRFAGEDISAWERGHDADLAVAELRDHWTARVRAELARSAS